MSAQQSESRSNPNHPNPNSTRAAESIYEVNRVLLRQAACQRGEGGCHASGRGRLIAALWKRSLSSAEAISSSCNLLAAFTKRRRRPGLPLLATPLNDEIAPNSGLLARHNFVSCLAAASTR